MNCSFPGCGKAVHAKGFCIGHYRQQREGETLRPLQQQFHGMDEAQRLRARLAFQPNGCWKWLGSTMKAPSRPSKDWHGQWRNGLGQHELTHRAAWRLFVGPIPDRAMVLHRCDNARCCNPEHLYLGTQADNVKDMWDRGRAKPGVSRGEDHGRSKLTEDDVRAIRKSDEPAKTIMERFGISKTQVYDIRKRRSWAHIE